MASNHLRYSGMTATPELDPDEERRARKPEQAGERTRRCWEADREKIRAARSRIATLLLGVLTCVVAGNFDASAWATTTDYFSATSANIRCDPPNPGDETAADTALVKKQQGGLLGTQDNCTASPNENPPVQPIVLSTLGTRWAHYIPSTGAQEVPIFWRKAYWTLILKGSTQISDSPARYATWVLLKNNATGRRIIRVNTHWIANAWPDHPERQPVWYQNQSRTEALARSLHEQHPAAGIIITGDFNQGDGDESTNPRYNVLGKYLGVRVIYDARVPYDSEMVIHLYNRHLHFVPTSTNPTPVISCKAVDGSACTPHGLLYTDHTSVSARYSLTN